MNGQEDARELGHELPIANRKKTFKSLERERENVFSRTSQPETKHLPTAGSILADTW